MKAPLFLLHGKTNDVIELHFNYVWFFENTQEK